MDKSGAISLSFRYITRYKTLKLSNLYYHSRARARVKHARARACFFCFLISIKVLNGFTMI